MRCFIPAAAFTAMNACSVFTEFYPWLVISFQHIAAQVPFADLSGPFGFRHVVGVFICPGSFIMRDQAGVITAAALGYTQVDDLRYDIIAYAVPISDNEVRRIFLADGFG